MDKPHSSIPMSHQAASRGKLRAGKNNPEEQLPDPGSYDGWMHRNLLELGFQRTVDATVQKT